eukprot:Em0006g949a
MQWISDPFSQETDQLLITVTLQVHTHNGVTLITEQQEPQQCEEQDTIVPVDLPNEEDSSPKVATGDPVEASGAYNGGALITGGYHSSVKSTIVPVDLPNEDSCPSQCLKKGLSSSTSSLEVSEGALHPALATGDLGKVVELKRGYNLTDNEKYFCLKNHFVPPNGYTFPSRIMNGQSRSFQASWLERQVRVRREKVPSICSAGCNAVVVCGRPPYYSIDTQLISDQAEKRIRENRLKIRSIAETVIFCGRQGIAMRGHRDDKPAIQENLCANHGNFLALLKFRIQAGDTMLQDHLLNSAGNALYTSKTIQNELITICGDLLLNAILKKVRTTRFFSIIADEATDAANDEQLSICIRFVDGEAIADNILTKLETWQQQPQFLRATLLKGNLLWKSGSAKSVLKKNGSVLRKCAELVGLSDMKYLRERVLSYVKGLSVKLQGRSIDAAYAYING